MHLVKEVLAADINQSCVNGICSPTISGFEGLFENVITAVLGFAGIALFIYFIIGGFKYITSEGDPKKTQEAKSTLTYAIGGMVLIAAAFLILKFIQNFTGAPVTQFKVVQ